MTSGRPLPPSSPERSRKLRMRPPTRMDNARRPRPAFRKRSTGRGGTAGARISTTAGFNWPRWLASLRTRCPRLRLKWAFGFPLTTNANAQPTVVGGLLFVGGGDSKVRALDAKSGCTRWAFPTEAPVRTAISFAPISDNDQLAIFFGDVRANVYAVNAMTGALIWKSKVDDHPAARVTGAPTVYSGVVYVGVSSIEEVTGSRPTYQCCTFRGSVVALESRDAARRSGRPTPSPRRRVRQSRMPSEPSSLVRPERRYGPHRRSMFSARRSMSRLGTAIPTRQLGHQ